MADVSLSTLWLISLFVARPLLDLSAGKASFLGSVFVFKLWRSASWFKEEVFFFGRMVFLR